MKQYANLSKKQILDYVKKFNFEDCKTTEEDYELIKKLQLQK